VSLFRIVEEIIAQKSFFTAFEKRYFNVLTIDGIISGSKMISLKENVILNKKF
jgi:hypothetical protein